MNAQRTILLVDDDQDFVAMNRAVLEDQGYLVRVAYNAEDCLASVEEEEPDLIVLDVMMATKSDGFNVCHSLRNDVNTRDIPIIMVTSVNEEVPYRFDKDDTWLPVDVFLDKPVKPERLIEEVRKRLQPQPA